MLKAKRSVATIALIAFSQTACYNNYFISKSELEKLESSAEQRQIVTVYGDCPTGTAKYNSVSNKLWAQNDGNQEDALPDVIAESIEEEKPAETATDAPATQTAEPMKDGAVPEGCTRVDVSTANALQIVTTEGNKRVTPFNFIMNNQQLVSPEYNLLENLNDVEGAEVSQFSTWKTVGTIAAVTLAAVGTFIVITIVAPEGEGF